MFWGFQEAKKHVILLKIKNFYIKTGLKISFSCHLSEIIFYSNSYTGKFLTGGKSVLRGDYGLIFGV